MAVRCSITIRQHARLRNLIEAIPETDWTPIPLYLDFGDGAERSRPSSSKGRRAPYKQSPNSCLGQSSPYRARTGRRSHRRYRQLEGEPRYVGIDVSKAQVDVAVRPTGQRWVVSYDETGVEELISQMEDLDRP